MHSNLKALLGALASGIVGFATGGCVTSGQLSQAGAFAAAAGSFTTQAGNAFTQLNESFVDDQIQVAADTNSPPNDATFTSPLDKTKGYRYDQKAVAALGAYATAINALATSTYKQDMAKASAGLYAAGVDLVKNAAALDGAAPAISDEAFGLVATIVNGAGDVIDEAIRSKAITQAVAAANPSIQLICAQIAAHANAVKSTYVQNLDDIYRRKMREYNATAAGKSPADRVAGLNQLRDAVRAMRNGDAFLADLALAATALAEAHAKLQSSLTDAHFRMGDLVAAIGAVQSFSDEMKAFNAGLLKSTP